MSCPNSAAHSRLSLSQASPCTLRWPYEYTTESASGLPCTGSPSGVIRRILPASDSLSWASPVSPVSPVPAYSILSGPKAIRPPLWTLPFGMPRSTVSGAPSCRPAGRFSS
ncbi:hypothetical protein SCALM49S_07030 [Streptomyces californicus]